MSHLSGVKMLDLDNKNERQKTLIGSGSAVLIFSKKAMFFYLRKEIHGFIVFDIRRYDTIARNLIQ